MLNTVKSYMYITAADVSDLCWSCQSPFITHSTLLLTGTTIPLSILMLTSIWLCLIPGTQTSFLIHIDMVVYLLSLEYKCWKQTGARVPYHTAKPEIDERKEKKMDPCLSDSDLLHTKMKGTVQEGTMTVFKIHICIPSQLQLSYKGDIPHQIFLHVMNSSSNATFQKQNILVHFPLSLLLKSIEFLKVTYILLFVVP